MRQHQEQVTYNLHNMKKILLILLLLTIGLAQAQGPTLPNAQYNITTTNTLKIKTPATVTSVNFLSTVEADGSIAKIAPVNLGFISGTATTGQVSFWNGTNTQTGDNALFWNNSTKVLGIGTNAPGVALDVSGTTFATSQIRSTSVSNTDNPVLAFRRSRAGTTAILANDVIGGLSWRGHDGTSYGSNVASINIITPQNYTGSVKPSYMNFQVTPRDSATPITPLLITGSGLTVDYDFNNPTGLQSNFFSTALGNGDNTTFKGVVAGTFLAKDRAGVTGANKGVLIGVQASVYPTVARNNVPFDDVNGVFIDNAGTAKATDAIYTSRNAGIAGSEWSTLWSSDANTDYGIRLMGVHTLQYLNFGNKLTVDKDGKIKNTFLTANRALATDASQNIVV